MRKIPYGCQSISAEDIDSVVEVLRSEFITQGPVVKNFENTVVSQCGSKYAIAYNSATSALFASCKALELGPGDEIWTSPISFVASANCGLYCGAKVDFVDIDSRTYNIDPNLLEEKLKAHSQFNRLPKILVVVHFSGQSADMKSIFEICQKYGVRLIEDASHAVGARYLGLPVGSCRYSDITVFSYHPVKIITTGEGGVATTNDKILADSLRIFREHGITRDKSKFNLSCQGEWYYEQQSLGFNFRMTDIQAALGISQYSKLVEFIETRDKLARRYNELLKNVNVILPYVSEYSDSSWHLYVVKVKEDKRTEVFNFLRENGILVNVHYIPIHTQPYYIDMGFKKGDFPEAESYYSQAISLPIHPKLTLEDQNYITNLLCQIAG